MENQRVHEYTVEQNESGLPVARIGRVHNLITFIREGATKVHFLNGQWVDDGRNVIPDDEISDELKKAVEAIPFKGAHESGADVLVFCEFCAGDQSMPSREYAAHLSKVHIRKAAPEPAVELEQFEAAEDDSFVRDDNGDVITNKDGSPRKKAGRPRK